MVMWSGAPWRGAVWCSSACDRKRWTKDHQQQCTRALAQNSGPFVVSNHQRQDQYTVSRSSYALRCATAEVACCSSVLSWLGPVSSVNIGRPALSRRLSLLLLSLCPSDCIFLVTHGLQTASKSRERAMKWWRWAWETKTPKTTQKTPTSTTIKTPEITVGVHR